MSSAITFNYNLIAKDYLPDPDNDDDRLLLCKTCIQELNRVERRILLTYVELGSYAASAREYNVSAPTFKHYLQGVMAKVRECSGAELTD